MPLNAKLIAITRLGTWARGESIPIPPFPGLGIRLDVYRLVNVVDVIVGDPGVDVTCIVEPDDATMVANDRWPDSLGFTPFTYP